MSEEQNQAIQAAYKVLRDDGGLRRTLRRIDKDPTEALFHEGAQRALGHLRQAGMSNKDGHALDALLLLAHVDTHTDGQLGRQLHAGNVQPARFRRLGAAVGAAGRPEALRNLRHMVQQCKGRVNVVDLAWTAYRWGKRPDGSTTQSAEERLAHFFYTPAKEEKP